MPSLRTLDAGFRPMAEAFFSWARRMYPGLTVTSARRSPLEQNRLYQAYLRGENDGLPAMPPGTSDHEVGLAMDLAFPGTPPLDDGRLWDLGAAWIARGGRWTPRDPVHFAAPTSMPRTRRGKGRAAGSRRRGTRRGSARLARTR